VNARFTTELAFDGARLDAVAGGACEARVEVGEYAPEYLVEPEHIREGVAEA
jgi:hypothetical protein